MLLGSGDFDKSPGSPTVGSKVELVQLQFCICPPLMCMEVALAVICQWLIRCGQIPSLFSSTDSLFSHSCVFTERWLYWSRGCLIYLQHKRTHFHLADYTRRLATSRTRNKRRRVLVIAEFPQRWINTQANEPMTGLFWEKGLTYWAVVQFVRRCITLVLKTSEKCQVMF